MDTLYAIPAGTKLYRAADTLEMVPIPRECSDTGKQGVYFSAFHPYLAETMILERDKPLEVAEYEVTRPITHVTGGKYAFRRGREWDEMRYPLPPEDNVSHIDFGTEPTDLNAKPLHTDPYAELFLTRPDLNSINFTGSYYMTVRDAMRKWYKHYHRH
jgi:hypothetical protein